MKVLNQSTEILATTEIHDEPIAHEITPTQKLNQTPDYTEMMIEIQKIGDPVSFESLKDFYNLE